VFFSKDEEGYSRGKVRPLFSKYFLDLAHVPFQARAEAFTSFFINVDADNVSQTTC